jgi:hypothetical protein
MNRKNWIKEMKKYEATKKFITMKKEYDVNNVGLEIIDTIIFRLDNDRLSNADVNKLLKFQPPVFAKREL